MMERKQCVQTECVESQGVDIPNIVSTFNCEQITTNEDCIDTHKRKYADSSEVVDLNIQHSPSKLARESVGDDILCKNLIDELPDLSDCEEDATTERNASPQMRQVIKPSEKSETVEEYSEQNLSYYQPPCTREATTKSLCNSEENTSVTNEAEDIVRKLCKNGKFMEFQEGEDYIKVIVYEDSQENDQEETLSAEEIESTYDREEGTRQIKDERRPSKNLLECFTDRKMELSMKMLQNSTGAVGMSQVADVQPNFNSTENQYLISEPTTSLVGVGVQQPVSQMSNIAPSISGFHHTPHPQSGYMFYVNEHTPIAVEPSVRRPLLSSSTPNFRHSVLGMTPTSSRVNAGSGTQNIHLNSSGEENVSPSDPISAPSSQQLHNHVHSLMNLPQCQVDDHGKIREQHNQKERRRRARIKEACNLLRQLVPGMSDKTDKATVFEFAARYVHFLKSHTGAQFDKDFLMKYSPY